MSERGVFFLVQHNGIETFSNRPVIYDTVVKYENGSYEFLHKTHVVLVLPSDRIFRTEEIKS